MRCGDCWLPKILLKDRKKPALSDWNFLDRYVLSGQYNIITFYVTCL